MHIITLLLSRNEGLNGVLSEPIKDNCGLFLQGIFPIDVVTVVLCTMLTLLSLVLW